MRGRLARIGGGALPLALVVLGLACAGCTGGRSVLDTTSTTAAAPRAAGPVTAQQLAGRLGMSYSDADTHVLLTDTTTRVRIWKDSKDVSIAGRTAQMGERTSRRGSNLLVPCATASYIEGSVGRSRASMRAPVRRPTARPALAGIPAPSPVSRPCAPTPTPTPIADRKAVLPAMPKLPSADPSWEPVSAAPRAWRWIVIHHSDDASGDLDKYDRIHRLNNGWDECGYHFVIGNGSLSGDGQIEVGSRWFKQKHGAHAKTPDNRFNDFGVGLCLVGDFETGGRPTRAQMDETVRLCRWLMARFNIPASEVIGHCDCKATACPGRYFPWDELKERLATPSL